MSRELRAAFTLVETILVVVLIGVLVALLMPTVGRVRANAQNLASMSNMHTHAQVLTSYAGDWGDYVPAVTDPHATLSVIRGGGEVHVAPYFHAAYLWNFALADGYYDGQAHQSTFYHPGNLEDVPIISYLLTASYMASRPYWNPETRRSDGSQLGHSRLNNTVFPSAKALLTEWHPVRGLPLLTNSDQPQQGVGLAFADGSADRFNTDQLTRPYVRGDGGGTPGFLPFGVYGMHTLDGWAGRDRK